MEQNRNAYRILLGKKETKRPVEEPGCRLKDNIEMDRKEM